MIANTSKLKFTTTAMSLLILLSGCGGGSSSGPSVDAESTLRDSIEGVYFIATWNPQTTQQYLTAINIQPPNKVAMAELYRPNSSTATAYTRKRSGTYTKSGEMYLINWETGTCEPTGQQSVKITSSDPKDRIFVTVDNVTMALLSDSSYMLPESYNTIASYVEDVGCNKFQ
ncbi:MAG TPA: hypothetical protein PLZ57_07355 [Pseudobdellovibrionaceae bacterium]|nr:hypothetical protein [Pseudobdellovibrionaceae bacterium]